MDAYKTDLAFIHDAGYGHFARAAAGVLLRLLPKSKSAFVVELGCGSGILAEELVAAGHNVLGYDISPAMIALARKRVPNATFRAESFLTADLPPCDAVCSIGEVFNYLFDRANTTRALTGLLRRIHASLRPGGLLLFDAAGPGRVTKGARTHFKETEDWAVGVLVEEEGQRLTRRITSFRKTGDVYRRDFEEHHQRLYRPAELMRLLRAAGFRARRLTGYGKLRFGPGYAGFLARKA